MRASPWALVLVLPACGGSSSSPASGGGSTTTTTTTQPPAGLPTVTISSEGVSPRQIEIPVGGRVLFVNNDTLPHEMYSDPHPSHETCPPMNEVNVLARGQSRQTGAFNTARTCGYHDHGQSTNTALQGTIVIR